MFLARKKEKQLRIRIPFTFPLGIRIRNSILFEVFRVLGNKIQGSWTKCGVQSHFEGEDKTQRDRLKFLFKYLKIEAKVGHCSERRSPIA